MNMLIEERPPIPEGFEHFKNDAGFILQHKTEKNGIEYYKWWAIPEGEELPELKNNEENFTWFDDQSNITIQGLRRSLEKYKGFFTSYKLARRGEDKKAYALMQGTKISDISFEDAKKALNQKTKKENEIFSCLPCGFHIQIMARYLKVSQCSSSEMEAMELYEPQMTQETYKIGDFKIPLQVTIEPDGSIKRAFPIPEKDIFTKKDFNSYLEKRIYSCGFRKVLYIP